jgi:hypothetical protein
VDDDDESMAPTLKRGRLEGTLMHASTLACCGNKGVVVVVDDEVDVGLPPPPL